MIHSEGITASLEAVPEVPGQLEEVSTANYLVVYRRLGVKAAAQAVVGVGGEEAKRSSSAPLLASQVHSPTIINLLEANRAAQLIRGSASQRLTIWKLSPHAPHFAAVSDCPGAGTARGESSGSLVTARHRSLAGRRTLRSGQPPGLALGIMSASIAHY